MRTVNLTVYIQPLERNDSESLLWEKNKENAQLLLPVIILLIILIIVGTIGNLLVCCVYGSKQKKTSTDCYILSLAILDLVSCCLGIPVEIADLYYSFMFYAPTACRLLKFIQSSTVSASNLILEVVAVDRYCKICRSAETYSAPKARKSCVFAIGFGIFLSWPIIVLLGKKSVSVIANDGTLLTGVECSFDDSYRDTIYPVLYFGILLLTTSICFVILTILYILIGIEIWQRRNMTITTQTYVQTKPEDMFDVSDTKGNKCENLNLNGSTSIMNVRSSQEIRQTSVTSRIKRNMHVKRTTVILFIVSISFFITFIPFLSGVIIREADKDFEKGLSRTEKVLFSFCLKSFFLNNAINPIIYSFLNVNFRRDASTTLRRLFCCQTRPTRL